MTQPTGKPRGRPRIHPIQSPSEPKRRGRPPKQLPACSGSGSVSGSVHGNLSSLSSLIDTAHSTSPQHQDTGGGVVVAQQPNPVPADPVHTNTLTPKNRALKSNPTTSQLSQNPTNTPKIPISEELQENQNNAEEKRKELQIAMMKRGETLEKIIGEIFPRFNSRERERIALAVAMTSDGRPWKEVSEEIEMRWIELSCLQHNAKWMDLWKLAKEEGEEARVAIREETAHRRAVEGWEEPVFYKGDECGRINKIDNRLLEFLIKADNPGKYRDAGAQVNIANQVQSVVVEMHRE